MKALPERFSERTITAKCAPEVTFTVRPLDNRIITYINTSNVEMVSEKSGLTDPKRATDLRQSAIDAGIAVDFTDAKSTGKFHDAMNDILNETKVQEWRINPVGGNYDEVAFGLVSITGVDGLDLDYETVKL